MKNMQRGVVIALWCLTTLALAAMNGCAVDVVDAHGYHHHGYYDNNHYWHGGYYDEGHVYHDDPHDWHQ